MHLYNAIDGLGHRPEAHVEWATSNGISQTAIVMHDNEAMDRLKTILRAIPSNEDITVS